MDKDLVFTVTADERRQVSEWRGAHDCRARPDSFGALLSYRFTPCGIGTSCAVLCACGAQLNLTRVDEW